MTKAKFRDIAYGLIDQLCSMPDDLWEDTYPLMRAVYKRGDEIVAIVVGLEEVEADD